MLVTQFCIPRDLESAGASALCRTHSASAFAMAMSA